MQELAKSTPGLHDTGCLNKYLERNHSGPGVSISCTHSGIDLIDPCQYLADDGIPVPASLWHMSIGHVTTLLTAREALSGGWAFGQMSIPSA